MARMPGLLRSFVLLTIIACSGCAEWHFRKDKKQAQVSGNTDGALLPLAQDVANASLHGWNFNSRW
jgi:hypothetical protein